jgi:hypothetical protein
MRNPLVLALALAVAACGPSSKEVASAKTAHYKGDKLVLFNAAKQAAMDKWKLAKSDENTLTFETEGRWFTPEGLVVTREGGSEKTSRDNSGVTSKGYDSLYPDNSINVVLVTMLVPDGDSWVVKVTPVYKRFHAGSPLPEMLKENDASLPGWAPEKVDQMALVVHKGLKQYEVQGVPQMAPPPAAPAAPPAEPKPADPAATAPATVPAQ